MTKTKMLIGSLSSDLYRVASLVQRGSYAAADRFLAEAQRWISDLTGAKVKQYIKKIICDIESEKKDIHSLQQAEKYLMYSILLQNYALHLR